MQTARFSRYVLRTTDAAAATVFYDAVLGHHGDAVFPLHEQALARGARPHWLGHLDVSDPAAAAAPLLAAGAQQLGPGPGGAVVLRDPGGALLALGGVSTPSSARVAWHVLRATNAEREAARYAELFGWSLGEPLDLGTDDGQRYRPFSWRTGEASAGVVGELSAGVHAQWLYFFAVASLDDAVASVRARSGLALAPATLPDGSRLAVCDDPQGAAFGLMQASGR
jgi:predicted enzyme related to lactoylglutathione lyase